MSGDKKVSNADRIRMMTDRELAEFLLHPRSVCPQYECEDCEADCVECVLEWLRSESNA